MKFGTPPPPQNVIINDFNTGGGGCVKGVGCNNLFFNLITPTYGKVGDF